MNTINLSTPFMEAYLNKDGLSIEKVATEQKGTIRFQLFSEKELTEAINFMYNEYILKGVVDLITIKATPTSVTFSTKINGRTAQIAKLSKHPHQPSNRFVRTRLGRFTVGDLFESRFLTSEQLSSLIN